MGEFKSCLAKVSQGYDNYLFTICNKYGNTAETLLLEYFEKLAHDIGKNNVIVNPINEAIDEARTLFEIKSTDDMPILVLTHMHPLNILSLIKEGKNPRKEISIIKIPLGSIRDKDTIKQILFKLMEFIKSDEYTKITWMNRKLKIDRLLEKIPIASSLKTIAIN